MLEIPTKKKRKQMNKKTGLQGGDVSSSVLDVPFYIDAFVGSQKVEAVQDSVAGDLDIIHWSKTDMRVGNVTSTSS